MPDYTIKALEKGTRVIEALGKYHRPMTMKEICYFTALSKNDVFRILCTLRAARFVEHYRGEVDRWCMSAHLCVLVDRWVESKLKRLEQLWRIQDGKKPDTEGA